MPPAAPWPVRSATADSLLAERRVGDSECHRDGGWHPADAAGNAIVSRDWPVSAVGTTYEQSWPIVDAISLLAV